MYPIIDIPVDTSSQLEQLGTKAKEWYWDTNGTRVLFKEGRPGTGENWAEKVCCEFCRALEIPHAEYQLARWGNREGVISPTFVPRDGRLVFGNELLAKIHDDYEETGTYRSSQHTVRRILAALHANKPVAPIGWTFPMDIRDAADIFVGYLLLDALVGNQDRHHENWALITSLEYGVCLAPSFDHASSSVGWVARFSQPNISKFDTAINLQLWNVASQLCHATSSRLRSRGDVFFYGCHLHAQTVI